MWDFGSAARHHQLYNPWLATTTAEMEPTRTPRTTTRCGRASNPVRGPASRRCAARSTRTRGSPRKWLARSSASSSEYGLVDEPLGVDVIELPVLFALQQAGVDGRRRPAGVPRGAPIKTPDEISLLTQAASMVDAAYDELYEFLRPGVRENETVGLVAKTLYDLGSEYVEGVNAISGRAVLTASARLLRPDHPAGRPGVLRHPAQLQRLPDLLLPHLRGRSASSGPARRVHAGPRVHGPGDRPG